MASSAREPAEASSQSTFIILTGLRSSEDRIKGIADAIIERQVAERTCELQEALGRVTAANRETIMRLAIAAEYKDGTTGAHIPPDRRVHAHDGAVDGQGCGPRGHDYLRSRHA